MKHLLLSMLLLATSTPAFSKMIKHESKLNFSQARQQLEMALKEKGLTIFATIDHQKAAKDHNLTMSPAVVYIFGNPQVGTLLMNDNMEWSYELPLKIAVYEKDGKVFLSSRNLVSDIDTPTHRNKTVAMNKLLSVLIQQ